MVPDHLLLQLLVTWLSPAPKLPKAAPPTPELSPHGCCRSQPSPAECTQAQKAADELPPLQVLRSSLHCVTELFQHACRCQSSGHQILGTLPLA